uniref:Excision repair cross-complementation group 6-like 2 n=1 Tax=Monopterus albus TaxID=43700 RepID=A0A3Q3JWG1_MONAL
REATIQRLVSTLPNIETTAWVMFTGHNKDAGEKEEEVEAIPLSELMRPGLNDFNKEKPVFPSFATDTMHVPLVLSDVDGDRVPYTINRYLRDYQRGGIKFIYNNYVRSRGCILGDDMGLGKTVQVIGFLAAVLHKTGTWEDIKNNRPQFLQSQMPSEQSKPKKVFLIVAPLSVLYNWKDELDTWGYFQSVVVHGLRKEEELARIKKGHIEIALTTFETLRLCLDQFNNIDWSAVVVDEAHKIKNPNSQVTQAMKELRCKIRIGLTGTILQNNLEELWCVMDWAIPGCLGSLGHFKNKFSDPIEQGQRHSATKRALAIGRKTVRVLASRISHWFLRRTKALIKEELPKKDDRVVYCSLSDIQQTVYQTVLDTEDVTLLLRSSEKCDCQSGRTRRACCYKTNSEGVQMKALYFSYLAILRKVANHVALLQSTTGTSKKQEKYVNAICQKVFQKFPDFVQRCKDEAFEALSDPVYSGKMKVLQKLLKYYLQKREKVLLFSLSTKLLDVLESYCMAEGLDYSRLDGTTKSRERVQIVKEFNSSSHINLCLVSTMAGGLGLNFVGANVVVLFDPTWNPANDLQAIDRVYRIGQCRDVTVLRLISLGSVEEVIYLRQIYKQQLQCSVVGKESARRYFEAVQGHGVHKGELFGIKNLFRLQTQGTCLTRQILEVRYSVLNDETGQENRGASKIPSGVLDFSSGSEEDEEEQGLKRKASNPNAVGSNRGGNAAASPGQISLLQHGFSRLLERVKGKPELDGDSSPEVEESPSDTDTEEKREGTSTGIKTGNGAVCLSKLQTKSLDIGSDREDGWNGDKQSDDAVIKRQCLKGWTNKKITVVEESDKNPSPDKKPDNLTTTIPTMHRFESYSEESEDLDLEMTAWPKKDASNSRVRRQDKGRGRFGHKRHATVRSTATSKYTEEIETFTSSDDEHIHVQKERSTRCHFTAPQMERSRDDVPKDGQKATTDRTERRTGMSKAVSFTSGVQEVLYTHSNQRVVGGSKAEELISRAAVRDVFERKMYSQFPANHLLGTQEVHLSVSQPDIEPSPAVVRLEMPTVNHPVIFTSQSVHHTRHTTFIIGETPQTIRRQQFEEMAEQFKFSSVYQFAVAILRRNSAQRLAWLRQYYTSLNRPDLASTVTNNFPQPDSAQTSSSPAAASSASTKTAATVSQAETRTPQRDVSKTMKKPKYTQEKQEPHTKQNNASVTQKRSRIPQNNVPESQTNSSGLGAGEAAAFLNRTDRDSSSSPDLSHGRSTMVSKPTVQRKQQEQKLSSTTCQIFQGQRENCQSLSSERAPSSSSNCSFLTDLLGDASILDDLLKPKSRGAQQRISTRLPTSSRITLNTDSVQASKHCHKDFWDILNEGNEESINRLTDPAEVQRVCISARDRSGEEQSRSLWKTNEKFLWKK